MTGPVTIRITLRRLEDAHAVVTDNPDDPAELLLSFGDAQTRVVLADSSLILRVLLTDALAQLDAISGGEETAP